MVSKNRPLYKDGLLVGRGGLEPSTIGLKGLCSTIELTTQGYIPLIVGTSSQLKRLFGYNNTEQYHNCTYLARVSKKINVPARL